MKIRKLEELPDKPNPADFMPVPGIRTNFFRGVIISRFPYETNLVRQEAAHILDRKGFMLPGIEIMARHLRNLLTSKPRDSQGKEIPIDELREIIQQINGLTIPLNAIVDGNMINRRNRIFLIEYGFPEFHKVHLLTSFDGRTCYNPGAFTRGYINLGELTKGNFQHSKKQKLIPGSTIFYDAFSKDVCREIAVLDRGECLSLSGRCSHVYQRSYQFYPIFWIKS